VESHRIWGAMAVLLSTLHENIYALIRGASVGIALDSRFVLLFRQLATSPLGNDRPEVALHVIQDSLLAVVSTERDILLKCSFELFSVCPQRGPRPRVTRISFSLCGAFLFFLTLASRWYRH